MGAASPFTYFDETIGALRSVRVAIILPGDSTLEKLMNDEKYSDRVDKLYQAGALVALMLTRPLVVEAACRARTLVASEMFRIRSAWCGVVTIAGIDPLLKISKLSI